MLIPADLFIDWQRDLLPAHRAHWLRVYCSRAGGFFSGNRQAVASHKARLLAQLCHELGDPNL